MAALAVLGLRGNAEVVPQLVPRLEDDKNVVRYTAAGAIIRLSETTMRPVSSCSPICAPMASRPSSFRAAGSSLCARGPSKSTASHRNRSSGAASKQFQMRDGKAVLVRLPELNFIDDKAGRPIGINQHIGRRRSPMRPFPRGQRRSRCCLSLPYSHWYLQLAARLRFLKVNLKRRAPDRGLLRRKMSHRQIHRWNFCLHQRQLIFMPTGRPSLNAFAMFVLDT